jgi:hypothetical protein
VPKLQRTGVDAADVLLLDCHSLGRGTCANGAFPAPAAAIKERCRLLLDLPKCERISLPDAGESTADPARPH